MNQHATLRTIIVGTISEVEGLAQRPTATSRDIKASRHLYSTLPDRDQDVDR